MLGDTTLAAALTRVISVIDVTPEDLPAIVARLPPRSDLVLGPLALTLTDRVVTRDRRLAAANAAAYEPALAASLNNLSIRLGEAGRRAEALRRDPGSRHRLPAPGGRQRGRLRTRPRDRR